MVIDDVEIGLVELRGEHLLGERHADRVGQALPERAGGGLDADARARAPGDPRGAAQLAEAP